MAPPIRVAFFGLSADPKAWANTTHFPALKDNPAYRIVALVNSSIASAQSAIKVHGLDPDTKAYDNPEDAANDPDVDLSVISVNVALHHKLAKPSILAGKDVFVEWPLGATSEEARDLAALAEKHGVKTMVGLQERVDPSFLKIKEIINSGKIGSVINTSIIACGKVLGPGPVHKRIQYFLDDHSGGNLLTIPFLHMIDGIFTIFGKPTSFQTLLHTGMPPRDIIDDDGKVVVPNYEGTAHDQIAFQGLFPSGVMMCLQYRHGETMDKGLRWYIFGSEGEIEITSERPYTAFTPEDVKIRLHEWGTNTITEIPVVRPAHFPTALQGPSIDLFALYDAFQKGDVKKFANFEDAVKMHEFLDEMRVRGAERNTYS